MAKRRPEPFSATLAEVRARPVPPPRARIGLHDDTWGDPDHVPYTLVTGTLPPDQARTLAAAGARVVYDACGCGGAQCRLDWLSPADVRALVGTVPVLHPSPSGQAGLEHWRSADGADLVVLAVDVTWGTRIPG